MPARAGDDETGHAGGVLRDVAGEGEYAYQAVVKIGGLQKFEMMYLCAWHYLFIYACIYCSQLLLKCGEREHV